MEQEALTPEAVTRGLGTRIVGRRVVCLATAESTMDEARREAEAGAPEGAVVLAEEQTGGRGRFHRAWLSPPGANLLLSVVLRPSLHELRRLNMAVTLAVARTVRAVTGIDPTVKWPNDVLLDRRKVSGILIESTLDGDAVRCAVAGIGLNVNFDPDPYPEIAATATSLMAAVGAPVSRLAALRTLLRELDELYASLGRSDAVYEEWRGLLDTLGQWVRVSWGRRVEDGLAADVDSEGNLILERRDGSRVTMLAGEVTLRG